MNTAIAPKEHPILFKGEMVRAILEGRKVMTRRVVKPLPPTGHSWAGWCMSSTHAPDEGKAVWAKGDSPHLIDAHRVRCPYGKPGDRLWVRETFQIVSNYHADCRNQQPPFADGRPVVDVADPDYPYWEQCFYAATEACPEVLSVQTDCLEQRWRPSIHMPRWASRILLEVTEVRVERLQEICDHEAICEGIMEYEPPHGFGTGFPDTDPCVGNTPVDAFRLLWQSINGPDSWALNPWVWVVSFRKLEGA